MEGYEILLVAGFSAAHRLRLADGSFEPLHGHNWRVEVELAGPRLDPEGMLADFTVLQPLLQGVTGRMHNTCLNDLAAFAKCNPSTELVARHIHDELKPALAGEVRITRVRVWETEECAAAYVPRSD